MKTEYSHKKIFSYFETESLKYNNKQTNDILYIMWFYWRNISITGGMRRTNCVIMILEN